MVKTLLAWSSGKDSAWTLHVLRSTGAFDVVGLLTTLNRSHDRVAMHAVRRTLLEEQARALGLPLHLVPIPYPCPNDVYEAAMARALADARGRGVAAVAFGDLFLEDVRRYREERMAGSGLEPVFPLWGRPTRALAHDMIDGGLRARLTCVDPRLVPAALAGRAFDRDLLDELPAGADPCGENGEFHSFTWDGPMFQRPVPVRGGDVVARDGFVFADLLPDPEPRERSRIEDSAPLPLRGEGQGGGSMTDRPPTHSPVTTELTGRSDPLPLRGEGQGGGSMTDRPPTHSAATHATLLVSLFLAATVSASQKPARVASLNLTADELLVEMLPPERLVGVTRFIDDPGTSDAAGRAPASAQRFPKADLERLVALAPDLVVVSEYTDADVLKSLERSGLRAHRMIGLDSPAGIRGAILALGAAVGEPAKARALVAHYDATLHELARRLQGATRPRVLYWANPHTAGGDTAIGALIETAGARNVGRELGLSGIVPLGAERAFVADPDVILVGKGFGSRAVLAAHPLLGQLRAVRQDRVIELASPKLVTLSHHFAGACWVLAHALHPELVPEKAP